MFETLVHRTQFLKLRLHRTTTTTSKTTTNTTSNNNNNDRTLGRAVYYSTPAIPPLSGGIQSCHPTMACLSTHPCIPAPRASGHHTSWKAPTRENTSHLSLAYLTLGSIQVDVERDESYGGCVFKMPWDLEHTGDSWRASARNAGSDRGTGYAQMGNVF